MNTDDKAGLARYDQLLGRVYDERRMPTSTRDLILALGWVTLRDPRRHDPAITTWVRTREVLNATNEQMWRHLADDIPRYDSQLHDKTPHGCQAPMVRVDRLCGRGTVHGFAERDPVTGWSRSWNFCNRPRCRAYAQPIWERARHSYTVAPEPIPNAGGLLPLFFTWDWEPKYRKAARLIRHKSAWEPPSYGLSADEWPTVPGQEPVRAFPKLRLIASNGETIQRNTPVLI